MKSKQCLDVQQMQHLQELGMDTRNALLEWVKDTSIPNSKYEIFPHGMKTGTLYDIIPAYTLQDVLDALPAEINSGTRRFWLRIDFSDECLYYYYDDYKLVENRKKVIGYDGMDGLIDAAYELLCWCIDNKFVETNKNK